MIKKDITLYFYSSTNTLRSYLARGMIASNAALQPHVHEQTLGNLAGNALFLTHMRIELNLARLGLEDDANLYPVIVEVRVLAECASKMPAHLLSKDGSLTDSDLKEYDPAAHIGAYVTGCFPFTMVSALLFESERDRDAFYDPSPNLWFPEGLYKVATQAERKKFKQSLDISLVRQQGEALDKRLLEGHQKEILVKTVHTLEKHKAIALICAHTARTVAGEEQVNIDALVLKLLALNTEAIRAQLPAIIRSGFMARESSGMEDLYKVLSGSSVQTAGASEDSANLIILRTSYAYFLGGGRAFKPDTAMLMNQISAALTESKTLKPNAELTNTLHRITQYFGGDLGISISKELETISAALPALKSLVMVLKNSSELRVSYFMDELRLFRLSFEEQRYALVLYAALNGLNPFEGVFKDKLWLNRLAEAYAAEKAPLPQIISAVYSHSQYSAILPRGARLPVSNKTSYVMQVKPLVDPATLKAQLLKALANDAGRDRVYTVLTSEIRAKAEIAGLTSLEYHQQRGDLLTPQVENSTILRFKSPGKEVRALNALAFQWDWLGEGGTFEARYKKSRDRRILLAIYHELARGAV